MSEEQVTTPHIVATSLSDQNFIADVMYQEPFGSASFNRKLHGLLPIGVYEGFNVIAAGGRDITIGSDDDSDVCGIDVGGEHFITVKGQKALTLTVPVSTEEQFVVVQANYGFGVITDQVDSTSSIKAVDVKCVNVGAETSNQIVIAKIATAVGDISQSHIDLTVRNMVTLALDKDVVHIYGDQDVQGVKTFAEPIFSTKAATLNNQLTRFQETVRTTSNQSVSGVKTFAEPIVSTKAATTAAQVMRKGEVDTLDAQNVKITGNQSVAGIKTFAEPIVSTKAATAATQVMRKGEVDNLVDNLDAQNVKITGNQTIAGVKTFSSAPVSSVAATVNNQLSRFQETVRTTSNQSVSGIKTFAEPIVSTKAATAATQVMRKGEVDTLDAQNVKLTGDQEIEDVKTFAETIVGNLSGNAGSATKLITARTINGTAFNGTANITTANWGTARNLIIGNKTNSVNGAGNITWTLVDIGAASRTILMTAGDGLSGGGDLTASRSFAVDSTVIRTSGNQTLAGVKTFSSAPVSSVAATLATHLVRKGELDTLDAQNVKITGDQEIEDVKTFAEPIVSTKAATAATQVMRKGEVDTLDAQNVKLTGDQEIEDVKTFAETIVGNLSGNAGSATKLQTARTINGTSFSGTANITTANWGTARNLIIGNKTNSVNGAGNITWSLVDIGAANRTLSLTAGDGLSGGGNLTANRSFAVDSTVVRTSGNQTIAGVKTFTSSDTYLQSTGNTTLHIGGTVDNVSASIRMAESPNAMHGAFIMYEGDDNNLQLGGWASGGDDVTAITIARGSTTVNVAGNVLIGSSQSGSSNSLTRKDYVDVLNAQNVKITGNQTIAGTKTFSSTISGSVSGNAGSATKLATARTIALSGDVTGSVSFNGSANVTIAATVGNDSHTHDGRYFTEAESDARFAYKAGSSTQAFAASTFTGALSGNAATATKLITARTINGTAFNGTANITTANWGTARTLTIGSKAQSVNGSANITWALADIGAASRTISMTAGDGLSGGGNLTASRSFAVDATVIRTTGNQTLAGVKTFSSTIAGSISGNAATATKATALATARTIALSGDVTGSVSFNGSANVTIAATVGNDSHTHDGRYFTEAESNARFAYKAGSSTQAFAASTFTGALSGNAATATKLITARTINGTSFNGTGNITTANWGTARSLTIGNKTNSVNGAGNVTWSLADIGAVERVANGSASMPFAYNSASSSSTGIKIRLPHRTNASVMVSFTVRVYQSYNTTDIQISGYLYSSTNNWYSPKAICIAGSVSIAVKMGRDADGYAYVWLGGGNYRGVAVTNVMSAHNSADWTTGWTSTITDTVENEALDTTVHPPYSPHNTNIGTGATNYAAGNHTHSYANNSLTLTAGDGLSGGGNLTANRSFAVDSTVVRTSGNQTLAGVKTFSSTIAGNISGNAGTATTATTATNCSRQVIAGNGLSGGGTLTADRTVAVGAGDGISVASTSVAVNSTVIRTTGNQTLAGTKTFSSTITGSISGNAGSATKLQTARTINGTSFSGTANITTANWGTARSLTIGNKTNSVNGAGNVTWSLADIGASAAAHTHAGSATNPISMGGSQNLNNYQTAGFYYQAANSNAGTGSNYPESMAGSLRVYKAAGVVQEYTIYNTNRTYVRTYYSPSWSAWVRVVNYGENIGTGSTNYAAGNHTHSYANNSLTLTAGDGLSGGGNLTANRSFAVDSTVVRTSGNQTIAGVKTFSSTIAGNISGNAGTATNSDTLDGRHATQFAWLSTAGSYDQLLPTQGSWLRAPSSGFLPQATGVGSIGTSSWKFSSIWATTFNGALSGNATTATTATNCSRQVIAGNGLSGGGTLTANRTVTVGAGDGISVASTSVAVNSTVIRTTGNQTLAGTKTFSSVPVCAAVPTADTHLVNKKYVDNATGPKKSWTRINAPSGLVMWTAREARAGFTNTHGSEVTYSLRVKGSFDEIYVGGMRIYVDGMEVYHAMNSINDDINTSSLWAEKGHISHRQSRNNASAFTALLPVPNGAKVDIELGYYNNIDGASDSADLRIMFTAFEYK